MSGDPSTPLAAAPLVSVVIPAFNAEDTIRLTLDALAAQDLDGRFEVIVVDDGSTDATVSIAEASGVVSGVLRQAQEGPGPARNHGAKAATAPILAFTDADCAPSPSWLRAGLGALREAQLVQGAVRPSPTEPIGPFDHTVWVVGEAGLYETANLFVDRELFFQLDGFEDFLRARIGKPLAEDVWFGWRARREGATTAFAAEALVHHAVLPRRRFAYVRERLRAGYFPLIAKRIPELRTAFFWRRYFLSARSAAFDAAIVGLVAGGATRRVAPLAFALPYVAIAGRRAWRWRGRAPEVLMLDATADLVSLVALAWGSLRARTPVL